MIRVVVAVEMTLGAHWADVDDQELVDEVADVLERGVSDVGQVVQVDVTRLPARSGMELVP